AQRPTSVSASAKGNFTSPNETNLIIRYGAYAFSMIEEIVPADKCTYFSVYVLAEEGLRLLQDVPVYGRIACMELFRPPGAQTDHLFISTERYKCCIVSFDPTTGKVKTEATADVRDRTGRPSDVGQIGLVHPDGRFIALHMYQGLLKIIPFDLGFTGGAGQRGGSGRSKIAKTRKTGSGMEAFNVRVEELQIITLAFVHIPHRASAALGVLYQDAQNTKHFKAYEIDDNTKKETEVFRQENLEMGASMLLPLPREIGGVIVIGEQTLMYLCDRRAPVMISMKATIIRCFAMIDQGRYLLGDYLGRLYLLLLELEPCEDGSMVTKMKLEQLGELIRLSAERSGSGDFFEVVDTFVNLAPISDFCVVDVEKQGQGQIVACCGGYKDGTLRIIRNGVGINAIAEIEVGALKGLWSLRPTFDAVYDNVLILCFIGETRILSFNDQGEMEEANDVMGFATEESTLFCANVMKDQCVQITASSVRLIGSSGRELKAEWVPESGARITVGSANPSQVVVALGGGSIVYIEIGESELREVTRRQLEYEISCVDISPVDPEALNTSLCAVGLWTDISVRILQLPTLKEATKELLKGEIIPRSVLIAKFEDAVYLFAALGDGQLFNFILDPATGTLRDRKKISLGTQPITLKTFRSDKSTHVFAASDRPTVIFSSNNKLLYSTVNLKEVSHMCPFNIPSAPNALALATDEVLKIGSIDEIQKLHMVTIKLGELPRRIAYQEQSRSFGVLTCKVVEDEEVSFLKLIDDQTYEVLDTYSFKPFECVQAIISTTLPGDNSACYVVGTAFAFPLEDEPKTGRIVVFQVTDMRQLRIITEVEVKGCAYSLAELNGGYLAAGVNSQVELFNWTTTEDGNLTLDNPCTQHGNVIALYLATRGDFILVGDIMKSMSLLAHRSNTIEEIARDFSANWMTAVEAIEDDTYIGAENCYNLFTLRRRNDAPTDDERRRLELSGQFHLGEMVNRFRHGKRSTRCLTLASETPVNEPIEIYLACHAFVGSLVMNLPENEAPATPILVFCTVNGMIGVVATLNEDKFQYLAQVQENINKVLKSAGNFDHAE
ncbi:DNA damage-binding protein 1a, partial [Quaeritorhiza haematococci]